MEAAPPVSGAGGQAGAIRPPSGSAGEVFRVFLALGLTSFGGPVAHLGFFRTEFVERRRWLDDAAFAEIVALCSLLPGATSSQVGMAVGLGRAGPAGAFAAWLGFTLPSALALAAFGLGLAPALGAAGSGWLRGLEAAAAAVVALAALTMARTLAPDRIRATIAVASAGLALGLSPILGQLAGIALGALAGVVFLRGMQHEAPVLMPLAVPRRVATASLLVFAVLLAGLPLAAHLSGDPLLGLADAFYRAGSLVFGGGHVVLPLLQAEIVPRGWLAVEPFMAGYAAAQAVPGPLFTFAAYLGAAMPAPLGGPGAALVALVAIFLPSGLLLAGVLPLWSRLRGAPLANAALLGTGAAVVGLVLAALYRPIWTVAIRDAGDAVLAAAAFVLLASWRAPPWLVVALCAFASAIGRAGGA